MSKLEAIVLTSLVGLSGWSAACGFSAVLIGMNNRDLHQFPYGKLGNFQFYGLIFAALLLAAAITTAAVW